MWEFKLESNGYQQIVGIDKLKSVEYTLLIYKKKDKINSS